VTKKRGLPRAEPPGGLKIANGSAAPPTSRQIQRVMMGGANAGRGTGKPTGTTSHFAKWKEDAAVRKHLQDMSTTWLAEQLHAKEEFKLSGTLHKLSTGFPNVWRMSQARRADLLEVAGVGPVGLDRLKEYLEKFQVALKWDEPRGD
jgi:hypothetical protein